MPLIDRDVDEIASYESKKELLKELKQEEVIKLFASNNRAKYQPPKHVADPLDQAVTVAITTSEKDTISDELKEIRKRGGKATVAGFCRKRTLVGIDVIEWKDRAQRGMEEFNKPGWNRRSLENRKRTALKRLAAVKSDDKEGKIVYQKQIEELNARLKKLERPNDSRQFRIKIRFTYSEAKQIRWRAARLSLTVADYIRFTIFGYTPFSRDDRNMSINARRQFYVSILDVSRTGWGTPPADDNSAKIARYIREIEELKAKNARLRAILTPAQSAKLSI